MPGWTQRIVSGLEWVKEKRGAFPPPPQVGPPSGLRIVDGKIEPPYSCELDVVDHCNLTCVDCNHASPAVAKRRADPDTVFRDFSVLAKVYRPQVVKVLGGEPLLHPELPAVLQAILDSGICDRIYLITNGLLLPRMPDAVWERLSVLEISVYPDSRLDDELFEACREKARRHGVSLKVYAYATFRATFSIPGHQDPGMVERIYRRCKLAHVWGCHVVHEGYFYRCPQSVYIPKIAGFPAEAHPADGLRIVDSPDFREALYRYLTAPEPLRSCRHCLGSDGKLRPHQMARPKEWTAYHDAPADSLIDYERLGLSEAGVEISCDGKTLLEEHNGF